MNGLLLIPEFLFDDVHIWLHAIAWTAAYGFSFVIRVECSLFLMIHMLDFAISKDWLLDFFTNVDDVHNWICITYSDKFRLLQLHLVFNTKVKKGQEQSIQYDV